MKNQSSTIQYRATSENSPVSQVSVAVVRTTHSSGYNEPEVRYDLNVRYFDSHGTELASPQLGQLPPHLRANFLQRHQEVRIHNVERGCIAKGQQFMARTFAQVLETTPEYQSFVLSNLSTKSIRAASLAAGFDPKMKLEPVGVLLQSLFACGLRNVRAFSDGGSAYVGLRALRHDAA